jgi:hypothetical protein
MYRNEDIKKIEENIDKIKDEASKEYKTHNEPTLNEISQVYKSIKNYLIKNKKIVYGGFAQNLLLKSKAPKESFYTEIDGAFFNWPDLADIEFYSPSPVKDIIDLTDELYSQGYKHIEAKQGIHPETYKVFINFNNYCDVSYIPTIIYNNIPTIDVDGIKCAHPHFMMVDAYRVMTDPMTSYWRLDKSLNRFQKLISYYPIDDIKISNILFNTNNNQDVLKFIKKKIIHNSKLIAVGAYAYNYYIKKNDDKEEIQIPYYEIISSNLEHDANHIYKLLTNKFKNIEVKQYHPFGDFLDKRLEYYYNNNLVLKLYGNNERCIVYNFSDKKHTHFGTFNLVIMYLWFNYFLDLVNKKNSNATNHKMMIIKLMDARNKYLKNHKITVIDVSPFQDFTFKCYGIPTDPIRSSLLVGLQKIKEGKRIKFRYEPTGKPGTVPEYIFSNTSGNENINPKFLIIKK